MAGSLFKLVGDIYINNDEANKSIQKTDDKASNLGKTLLKGTQTVAKWGAALAGAATGAAAGLMKVATSASESADEIDKASIRMGISTDSYQELRYAAEQCGVEMGTLEKAAKKLEGTDMTFDEAIESIMSLGTEAERTQKASELFGDSIAYTLSPILASSGEDFNGLRDRAHELGIVMSEEDVAAGVKLGDTMSDVKKAIGGVVTQLGSKLVPIVQKLADTLLEHLPQIEALFDEIAPVLEDLLETILPLLLDLAAAVLPPIFDLIKAILPLLADLAKTIFPLIANVLGLILPVVTKLVEAVLPPLLKLLQPILDLLNPIFDIINTILSPFLDLISLALEPLNLLLTPLNAAFKVMKDVIDALAKPVKTLGSLLSGLSFPSIEIPAWAKKLLGIEDEPGTLKEYSGTNYSSGRALVPGVNIKTGRASGGTVDSGEVFIARENGMPEYVGRFGDTTGVANNEQIQAGIAAGVAAAMQPVENLLTLIYKEGLSIDGERMAKALAPAMNYQLGVLKG